MEAGDVRARKHGTIADPGASSASSPDFGKKGPPSTPVPNKPLNVPIHACIHVCMATKTISVDIEAYERLRRARRVPTESFSQVIKRAEWPEPPKTANAMIRALASAPVLNEEILERLDRAQDCDPPPEDPWRAG